MASGHKKEKKGNSGHRQLKKKKGKGIEIISQDGGVGQAGRLGFKAVPHL